jgi:hypothetical protein
MGYLLSNKLKGAYAADAKLPILNFKRLAKLLHAHHRVATSMALVKCNTYF